MVVTKADTEMTQPDRTTGANAGGSRQSPVRALWAALIAQLDVGLQRNTMPYPSYKALLAHYKSKPQELQDFFTDVPALLASHFAWEVLIAYQFIRLETGLNRVLYGGLVKLHRADKGTAGRKLSSLHITRESFLELFKNVYGARLPTPIVRRIKSAEAVRDKSVHGKGVRDPAARQAIGDALDYAEALDGHVFGLAQFHPFGDMRGFKGAGAPLPPQTTYWLLKGMGI